MARPAIHVEPKLVVTALESKPMRELRQALGTRYRASETEARSFAERLLIRAVERFGEKYATEMAERIGRIFERRDQAARIVDQVIGAEALSPADAGRRLQQLFDDIKRDVEAITGPAEYAKKAAIKPPDDVDIEFRLTKAEERRQKDPAASAIPSKPLKTGQHVEQADVLARKFKELDPDKRQATRKGVSLAPQEVWKAITSETESALEKNIAELRRVGETRGMNAKEIADLESAVREMALERARSQRLPGTAEGVLRTEGLKTLDPKLRKLVEGDRLLELLAAENPALLSEWFVKSGAKTRSVLRGYVRWRMVRHMRGLLGEWTAVFLLGHRLIFLKIPDEHPTIPGTDFVGVTRDGRVWLVDNKAWSQSELHSVEALMDNIRTNIADDTAKFSEKFGFDWDPEIGDAVSRLDSAMLDIKRLTDGLTSDQIAERTIQQNIAAICAEHGIERVVTNAGGTIEGLAEGLRKAEIRLEDLNKPVTKKPVTEDPAIE